MANEILGKEEELKEGLVGEESWGTEVYQKLYNQNVGEIEVYEIKPWDVQVGDVLKLRPREILKKLNEAEAVPAHWYEALHNYIEENMATITVDEEMYMEIYANESIIKSVLFNVEKDLYWHLSLPMFTFEVKQPKKEEEEKEQPPIHSIRVREKDPLIIEEMIKKVDRRRFRNLLNISASIGEDSIARVIVSNEMVDKYLRLWAEAKYEFYLLFNRSLTLEEDIEFELTNEEMKIMKKDLCKTFPKYGIYVNEMPTSYFISNEMSDSYLPSAFDTYASPFFSGRGMKLSKFFTNFLQDELFDIELSKIMQNKTVTGTVYLSIDPYDYLTSSINKHNWKSCHRITDGEWGTGSLSYMLDEATIVSYRAKRDSDYDYNFWGFKFKGNSKLHRQLVYFDKDSCSIIFGRQYPRDNDHISKAIRNLLEDGVASYLDIENVWKLYNQKYDGEFEDVVVLHYSDVHNDFGFKFAKISDSKDGVAHWKVGSSLPCLCGCGNEVTERGERAICGDCIEEHGDAEDYYGEDED